MLFIQIRRLFAWFVHPHKRVIYDQPARTVDSSTVFDFDPMWHGDHWQNLLSSPMDARRYVMEDWTASPLEGWDDAEGTAPAH
ncbi:hypothetical protein BJG93_00865 [Paraburkholderia sprentiae WSM5005]|uniref:Uncharacterized protein n=1 Tax=Paraburkholderia sprentiae WSM5005 TaxID=754502 RepID=A0A1I9YKI8_9BURK|nr:hypothetical protein [Paraburkholderia sprentiae]APA86821.1 hypothetical protein BJG93_00865 [Paraburkholderia sprentiae WSM5005]